MKFSFIIMQHGWDGESSEKASWLLIGIYDRTVIQKVGVGS